MARIRTIKPQFWTNEDLSMVSEPACLLAIALLNYADDEGFFNANAKLIESSCFPLRELSVNIHGAISELSNIGYIELGTCSNGRRYGHIVNFLNHQKINRPNKSQISDLEVIWDNKKSFSEYSVSNHGVITDGIRNKEGNKEIGISNKEKEIVEKIAPQLLEDVIKKKKEKEIPLVFPYESEKFKVAWGALVLTKKWKPKLNYSLQLSLDKLKKYDEEFAIMMIEEATEKGWQGLEYENTQDKYQKYLNHKNGIKNGTANQGTNLTARLERNQSFGTL